MVKILEGSTGAADLARTLHDLTRRLQALERSTQASHTSIEGGAMDIYDADGSLKGSVGVQPDGGVALVPVNPTPPPTPTAPAIEPVLAGLVVGWDGTWADAYDTPSDFALVQVHVGTAADFVPSLATQVGTITAQAGGTATIALEGYAARWVRLVGQNTGQITGPPSAATPGTPRQAVGQDLLDGIIGEVKLAKDAVTAGKIALGAVTDAALAAGAVTMNALGGALADGITQRYVDAMGDPKAWRVLNQPAGAAWAHLAAPDAPTGRTLARATGYTVVRGTVQVPYDPDGLYRISARVRTVTGSVSGTDTLYVGALGVAADGVTLVNRNGANSYTSGHYVAASNTPQPAGSGWTVYTGYLRGRAATGSPGTGGAALDPRTPGVMHADTRFISPLLYLNFGSGTAGTTGVMDVDAVTIEVLKTGIVDSTNLVVGSVTTAALAADAVAAGKISAEAVTAREIKAGAVNTGALAAGSVTAEKILALAVTAEKIAVLAVTAEKIAALAVTADKLAANAVTATKIAAGVIDATHVKAGSLTADKLAIGTDGNLIADPSFEAALSDQRVAAAAYWSIAAGNGTPRAVRVDATSATAVSRPLDIADLPAVPGQKVWLAVDYLASTDWAGARISIYAQWLDAAGTALGASIVTTGDGLAVRGSWQRLAGAPAEAAPAGTVRIRVRVVSVFGTAGTVAFDNAVARFVVASGSTGARAELSPLGIQLFDQDGSEAVALVTGRPNYLTLATDQIPVATIDQLGNAGFSNVSVAGSLTVGGDRLDRILANHPRGLVAVGYPTTAVSTGTTEYGYMELGFEANPTRMYRVVFDCYADPAAAGGEVVVVLRDGGAATPTLNSPQIQSLSQPTPWEGWIRVHLETIRSGADFGTGFHRLLITFRAQGGPAGQTVRLLGGSNFPGLFYVEDIGPSIPDTGVYNPGGGNPTFITRFYKREYAASWSGSYMNRGPYNATHGNACVQGYSSVYGMQSALIGFPVELATDLAGATILKAEVLLCFDQWASNTGGTAVIRAHKHPSRPATFSCDSEAQAIAWTRNTAQWVDITSVFDHTSWRGIALDPNNADPAYSGRARGVGQPYAPVLRVTCKK
ncbi:hypothetical protein [Streptomyces sp. NPDC058758]|uniref:hypothetical protein n=1 Tax=Streptomyces sp. NPDC058758 TaxID=3346627 RepID=UPI003694E0DC